MKGYKYRGIEKDFERGLKTLLKYQIYATSFIKFKDQFKGVFNKEISHPSCFSKGLLDMTKRFSFIIFTIVWLSFTTLPCFSQSPIPETIKLHKGEIEFKRGDILVKANHNNLIGSSFIEGGATFGHAAIVLEGGKDTNVINLLKRTTIFESHSRDVPNKDQIRKIKAYQESTSKDSICLSFSNKYIGGRYLLRANLSENQIEKIIQFITDQDHGTSSWRATKDYKKINNNSPRNWYCSLIIWQAFYNVLEEDIDVNKGLIVYPNDIINSPLFSEQGSIFRF